MDVGRFLSLLTSRSLYFACPNQFEDPYEGWLPRSHHLALSQINRNVLDSYRAFKAQLIARGVPENAFDAQIEDMRQKLRIAWKETIYKFGVSCWHESDHESEAMWKLYSAKGQGIAIESTVERLRAALQLESKPIIDRVRYADFENDPVEKGHVHYGLFLKRKSFSHEREIRATILLQAPGHGVSVSCDLKTLVTVIHVSPLERPFLQDAIQTLCAQGIGSVDVQVKRSALFDAPPENWPDPGPLL